MREGVKKEGVELPAEEERVADGTQRKLHLR